MAPMQGALAADADIALKAPPPAVELPWWTHGFVELGGRGFLNDPTYGGHIVNGQGSLAKFYEYRDLRPGPFGDFNVATGSRNGLYEIDAWGFNPGYRDQAYNAYLSKAGEQYLNLEWDQTPHVYSTSSSTLFNTNGNALTLANPNIGHQMFTQGGAGWPTVFNTPAGVTAFNTKAAAVSTIINQNVHPTDIGILRDTASVDYRYTPTDNWDIKANYSNMRRTGSQVDSVLFTATNTGSRVDVAKPVSDRTQNFGVNGEYIGTSAWGQKFNAMVGYNGSVYTDDFSGYTVQNPFCDTGFTGACAGAGTTATAPLAQMSTPPSNQMNGITGTFGADLPVNSRYMGTVSYSGMRQNDQFLPFTINPGVNLFPNAVWNPVTQKFTTTGTGVPGNSLASLPAQSLNGSINTLLINNVVTTQVTSDLKTKVSYRYYDYDNQTPQLQISDWIIADATSAKTTTNSYAPVNPLMVGYIKQNGAAEATYRPVNSVNLGASYGVEHYDFTRFDAAATTENTVKFYADWKPASWVTARASASYGERRAGDYDYLGNVGMFQWPVPNKNFGQPGTTVLTPFPNSTNYSEAYRQFYLDDRNRSQAKFQIDIDVIRNFTVTPTINIRNDGFLLTQNELGLTKDNSTAVGVELAYATTPDLRFLFSYMNEQRNQQQLVSSTNLAPYTAATSYICPNTSPNGIGVTATYNCQSYSSSISDRVNTFIFGVNYAVIPQRVELGLNYTLSMGKNSSPLFMQDGTGPVISNALGNNIAAGQFPDVTTTFQRLEANAKYTLDPDLVHSLGWTGGVSLKLRYAWERNSVTNWNTDLMQPYMYQTLMQSQVAFYQALAGNNPNYNVHMLGGTIAWAW
ncbi:MtrB/PioB family outer membrane beta-barrel protein [Bradyrhizobium sp.]|uniref:MtrB/PioB family outer membrane beta-barrel protein n=1 Tax=Bradyrhizobium sp. TaxID=376 RepID=UPI0025BAD15C|nr:MtrB/PioB family outer membrane beta-barrel protein [Bradyrhizobium sp.]